jgi:transcriptional regulator with XRE-family HTH domain
MPAPRGRQEKKRTAHREKDEALLKRFTQRLAKARKDKGMSLYALAKAAKMTTQAVINLEEGTKDGVPDISLSRAVWIARALGIRLDDLVSPD